jgi:hypothetical protein
MATAITTNGLMRSFDMTLPIIFWIVGFLICMIGLLDDGCLGFFTWLLGLIVIILGVLLIGHVPVEILPIHE